MTEPPGPPHEGGGGEDRAPTILGVFASLTTVSILCVVARLYTRFRLLRAPGADDAVILISIVGNCNTSSTSCILTDLDTGCD